MAQPTFQASRFARDKWSTGLANQCTRFRLRFSLSYTRTLVRIKYLPISNAYLDDESQETFPAFQIFMTRSSSHIISIISAPSIMLHLKRNNMVTQNFYTENQKINSKALRIWRFSNILNNDICTAVFFCRRAV